MIEEVMQRAADHEGLRRYFDPDTPGHKSGEKAGGNDELKRELRQLVGG
jgi:hypothetical protein